MEQLRDIGVETSLVPSLRRPVPPFIYSAVRAAAGRCDAVIGVNQRDRAVAVKVADQLGVPAILAVQNQHNFWGAFGLAALKRRYYARSVARYAALCVCTSKVVKAELVAMGVDPKRCEILHNGIEMPEPGDGAGRHRVRRALGLSEHARAFINVGRLDVQKGQDLLLEAWARTDRGTEDRLLVVGDVTDGNQHNRSRRFKQNLLETARRLGIEASVVFLGWRDDVPQLLNAADVYVHAARWEGWPLTVVEAMAASKPFIMTDCSGPPIGFESEVHGFVVATDAIDPLADAMARCLAMPTEDLERIGKAARELAADNYDIEHVGTAFARLVERAIAR